MSFLVFYVMRIKIANEFYPLKDRILNNLVILRQALFAHKQLVVLMEHNVVEMC